MFERRRRRDRPREPWHVACDPDAANLGRFNSWVAFKEEGAMKITVNRAAMVVGCMSLASCIGGGSCCQSPATITQQPTTPTTTGAKVQCDCTLTTSAAAQQYGHFPATMPESVTACLPENFAGQEEAFCNTSLNQWIRVAAEQIAITVGPSVGVPSDCVSAAACAGTCYGGFVSIPDPIVTAAECHAAPFGAEGPLSEPESQCMFSADAGTAPDAGGACAPVACSVTTDPTLPNGANCLIQNNNIDFSHCNCTEPSACGNSTTPICALAPGTADPPVLVTSPMGLLASRTKLATIDHDSSTLSANVSADAFCAILCDHVSGSATTHVTGSLNLYGGPCPGTSCNVQLDGIAYVDDFNMHVTDDLDLVDENHTLTSVRVKLAVPTFLIPVDATGTATIPAGQFTYDVVGFDNGTLKETSGVSDQPVTIHIDWNAGTITGVNLVEPFGGGSATLNFTAHFQKASLVDQMQSSLATFDADGDGVPDRVDNCPLVPNTNQVPVPPTFGTLAPLTLTACSPGAPVSVPTPAVTDPCDKLITVTGAVISVDGASITPIPILASGPIVIQPPFDAQGHPIPPSTPLNGKAVIPPGTAVIRWTAVDSNGATNTATQTVSSSAVPTLYGAHSLRIDDGTVVKLAGGGLATVENAGPGQTFLGVGVQVGNLLSAGPVFLSSNALVGGFLKTGQTLTLQTGVQITGPITQHATGIVFAPAPTVSATFPSNPPTVDVEPGQSKTISAGAYGSVAIKSNATLTLGSGTYTMTSLDIEPQATVKINSTRGSVVVTVQQAIVFNGGSIVDSGNPQAPDFLLGYVGTQAVNVATPFNGAIFAPHASLTLHTVGAPGYTGQFYAQDLEAGAHMTVTHRAYHCVMPQ
jgi:hypothetical protein